MNNSKWDFACSVSELESLGLQSRIGDTIRLIKTHWANKSGEGHGLLIAAAIP